MRSYLKILEELGWPRVFLVSPKQYESIDGLNIYKKDPDGSTYSGFSSDIAPVITLRHNLRGKLLRNTIYHEILHILYPHWPHWKIECAAELLARGGGRGYYSNKYGHTPEDLHKTREELLTQIRRQVLRFNAQG